MIRSLNFIVEIFILLTIITISLADASPPKANVEYDSGDTPKSVANIIKSTVSAITGSKSAEDNKNLLLKHYFTDKKSQSIWAKIWESSEKQTGVEFTDRELADMENAVKTIYRRLLECDLNNMEKKNSADLVNCYFSLNSHIQDGFVDFSYPRQDIEGQTHIFEMNVAYNLMCLLILRMTKAMATSVKMETFNTEMSIYKIGEALLHSTKIMKENAIEVRLRAISEVEICQNQEILWHEFEGYCETRRVKRDVAGIGGSSAIFEGIFRAKVTDEVANKKVCNMGEKAAPGEDAAVTKDDLVKSCQKKRKKYAERIEIGISRYYKGITSPIINELPMLWGKDEEKLKKIMKDLQTKLASKTEQ